jgi:single-strand DNA-binding protein
MSDTNICVFTGRLGKDPESRFLPNGDAVCNFSVACGDQWKSKGGEKMEHTEWVRCGAFGKLAEICGEYLKKGSQVLVMGKMHTRKWQDKEGVDRYSTEIKLEKMQMLGSKADGTREAAETTRKPNSNKTTDESEDIPF